MKTKLDAIKESVKKIAGMGDFILVELVAGDMKPVYDGFGQLMVFKTGGEAGSVASKLSDERGWKVQPRRIVDADWRKREQQRMKDGTYQPLPWHDTPFWKELEAIHKDHFPHVSREKGTMVAFTEVEEKGSGDCQTRMKIGRYLERYFSEKMNKFVIRDLACIFASKFEDNELQFASDPEDMEDVYVQGPNSCMSKDASQYATRGVHPVRAYAAGDLQVAYMRRKGKIVARTVVWPEKKTYNNIYGDSGLLRPLLDKKGFKSGAPVGARLLKIKQPSTDKKMSMYVCPHVDNVGWVKDGGEFLLVGDPRANIDTEMGIQVPGGAGLTEAVGIVCPVCTKDTFTARHVMTVYTTDNPANTQLRCHKCVKESAVACCYSGYYVDKSVAVELGGNRFMWTPYVKNNTFVCEGDGKIWTKGEKVVVGNKEYSSDFWRKQGQHYCYICGEPRLSKAPCEGCANTTKVSLREATATYGSGDYMLGGTVTGRSTGRRY